MSLRSSIQQSPGMSSAIGYSRESNPSRTFCILRAVPQSHVADISQFPSMLITLNLTFSYLSYFKLLLLTDKRNQVKIQHCYKNVMVNISNV